MIIVKGEARLGNGEMERLRAPLNAWIAEVRQREGCLSFA
jgi:quinol monooxygenase YgiN